jgi:hypothetical protein
MKMPLTYVTALILPRNGNPYRSIEKYVHYYRYLVESGIQVCLFLDERINLSFEGDLNVHVHYISMKDYWITTDFLPSNRNMSKDTDSYMSIQLMKLWCVQKATELYDTPYFAWIDFGAFHMFKDILGNQEKLRKLSERPSFPNTILAPGCWHRQSYPIWDSICWRFCGTFFIGPRHLFRPAYELQCSLVHKNLPKLTWEVNYWTMMEEYFTWYFADHNDLLLDVPI